jgi:SOS-response transcriptional repressor LexA
MFESCNALEPTVIDKTELIGIFAWICQYVEANSFPPTLRELSKHHYMSVGRIHRLLTRMELLGWIAREPGLKRGITLLRPCETLPPSPERPSSRPQPDSRKA